MADVTKYFDTQQIRLYNIGYSDGFNLRGPVMDSLVYYRGYLAGVEQKAEDAEAMASGDLDSLSESECDFLYGIEEKVSDYK